MSIKKDTYLSPQEIQYCQCLVRYEGQANPFTYCYSQIGVTTTQCMGNYNFSQFSDKELQKVAYEHYIPIPQPYNREEILVRIANYLHFYQI